MITQKLRNSIYRPIVERKLPEKKERALVQIKLALAKPTAYSF
jgi:hypothetical protein